MGDAKRKSIITSLFVRYAIILLAGLGNLWLFYKTLTPLTIKTTSFILSSFGKTLIINNTVYFNTILIKLIPACIAGSAYYLLFILILATPNINLVKRLAIITTSFLALFILNTLRIVFLALINQSMYFESIHIFFWYIISTFFVVMIWIFVIKMFKIKQIPVYSDIKYLGGLSRKSIKKTKRRK